MKTHYEQLGLTPQASARAIAQPFLRLSKKYDPKEPANAASGDAVAAYQAVHEAYRALNDPQARRDYYLTLRTQTLAERVSAARLAHTAIK